MPKFNGHRSWNAWNVALWIGNDEGLYSFAVDCVRSTPNLRMATERFLSLYSESRTPDGANYNPTCVREALAGLEVQR